MKQDKGQILKEPTMRKIEMANLQVSSKIPCSAEELYKSSATHLLGGG